MSFQNGERVGIYEIVGRLGAGAMGEVYRARDSRLGRDVAIKVLQNEIASDPGRRARFEKEARIAAALNHPNIVAIHDVGEHAGQLYIVSELVEGKTLRQRITEGSIGLKELYRILVQLADGLAAAHSAEIVHRDLKPDNVILTHDGRVKILDFGLARQEESSDATATMTMGAEVTIPGTVMGTAAYMSPEQANGRRADYRSDQFSVGVIAYELATGVCPFRRETAVQTMSAVLTEEVPPIESSAPPPLRWVIARCLEKKPADRYDSTRDLYRELAGQQEHLSEVFASAVGPALAAPNRRWGWVAAVVGLLGICVALWALSRGDVQLRYTPMEVPWQSPSIGLWSPDGKAFAYSAMVGETRQVFVRYLSSPTPVRLTKGTEAFGVFGWSPDGKRLIATSKNPKGPRPPFAFFTIPITGGDPQFLVEVKQPSAAIISRDGSLIATLEREPDLTFAVFTASPVGSEFRKYPFSLPSKEIYNSPSISISPDNSFILLSVDDANSRRLWKLPFPADRGKPEEILVGKLPSAGSTPQLSFGTDSSNAVVALQERFDDEHQHLALLDLSSGNRTPITGGTGSEFAPMVSPDGWRILYLNGSIEYQLVSMSLEDGSTDTIIRSDRLVSMPAWALNQEKFVYVTSRNGSPEIWIRENGADRPLVTAADFPPNSTRWFMSPSLSPDGERVIYTRIGMDNRNSNWISAVSGGAAIRLTSGDGGNEYGGAWSPDGRRYAFLRIRGGELVLAVAKTSGEAPTEILRTDAISRLPDWSPDGKWIRYLADKKGWVLLPPEGKEEISLGNFGTNNMAFSKDSRTLYGIRTVKGHGELFSVDIATKAVRRIADVQRDLLPTSPLNPGVRLSLSPDGKRILYSKSKGSQNLWMVEGFRRPGWRGLFGN